MDLMKESIESAPTPLKEQELPAPVATNNEMPPQAPPPKEKAPVAPIQAPIASSTQAYCLKPLNISRKDLKSYFEAYLKKVDFKLKSSFAPVDQALAKMQNGYDQHYI